MEYKKQHYIPQTYLSRWCDIEKPPMHDDYVWIFNHDGENPKKKSPKNIFYENDLYTIYEEGKRILDIEHGLSELESVFSYIRNIKIDNRRELSKEERLVLLTFVAAMHNRTPDVRDHISRSWGEILDLGKSMQKSYENASEEQRKVMRSIGRIGNGKDSMTMQEVELAHTKPFETMLFPRIATDTEIYSRMHMSILMTKDEVGFITSDTPVVWFDPEAYKRPAMYRSIGLGYPDVEVILPISPNAAIIISHNELPLYIDVKTTTVDSINRKTRFSSSEYYVVNKCFKNDFWFLNIEPPLK